MKPLPKWVDKQFPTGFSGINLKAYFGRGTKADGFRGVKRTHRYRNGKDWRET
jgi:hypothetical protein